jgi:Fe-S-cluster containining protein
VSNWERKGECNHCGHCCTMVAREAIVRTDVQIARDPAFYAARGFVPMDVDGETRHVLFAWLKAPCPQQRLQTVVWGLGDVKTESRCAIHATRPETCVTFPRLPVDIVGTPCSYWFEREVDGTPAYAPRTERVGGTGSPHPATEQQLLAMEG